FRVLHIGPLLLHKQDRAKFGEFSDLCLAAGAVVQVGGYAEGLGGGKATGGIVGQEAYVGMVFHHDQRSTISFSLLSASLTRDLTVPSGSSSSFATSECDLSSRYTLRRMLACSGGNVVNA